MVLNIFVDHRKQLFSWITCDKNSYLMTFLIHITHAVQTEKKIPFHMLKVKVFLTCKKLLGFPLIVDFFVSL